MMPRCSGFGGSHATRNSSLDCSAAAAAAAAAVVVCRRHAAASCCCRRRTLLLLFQQQPAAAHTSDLCCPADNNNQVDCALTGMRRRQALVRVILSISVCDAMTSSKIDRGLSYSVVDVVTDRSDRWEQQCSVGRKDMQIPWYAFTYHTIVLGGGDEPLWHVLHDTHAPRKICTTASSRVRPRVLGP